MRDEKEEDRSGGSPQTGQVRELFAGQGAKPDGHRQDPEVDGEPHQQPDRRTKKAPLTEPESSLDQGVGTAKEADQSLREGLLEGLGRAIGLDRTSPRVPSQLKC